MRYLASVFVFTFAFALVAQEAESDLGRAIWGTPFIVKDVTRLRTAENLSHDWDKDVVQKATRWANTAEPNLTVVVEKKGKVFVMKSIHSAADPWDSGKTPMHAAVKPYEGKVLSQRELNRLAADFRTACHAYFKK